MCFDSAGHFWVKKSYGGFFLAGLLLCRESANFGLRGDLVFMANFIWPVPGFMRVTSGFRTLERPGHNGIDIGRNLSPNEPILGAEIVAVADGYVAVAQDNHASWGNWIEIDDGSALRTRYAHNQINLVRPGQFVRQGEVIALVGSTGRSTAPHLHFEFIYGGLHRDPLEFLDPALRESAPGAAVGPSIALCHEAVPANQVSGFISSFLRWVFGSR